MIRLKHKQHGLSLIELMIAVALSIVLTLGVIQIFMSSKQTSRVQNSLARLQESARFALDLLAHDIRMAGQLGCDSSITPTDNSGLLRPFGNGIFGYEYDGLPAVLITDNASNPSSTKVIAGTDTIIVMAAASNSISTQNNSSNVVRPAAGMNFSAIESGEPMLISDCENADIFIADKQNNNKINTNLSKKYKDFSRLSPLTYSAYYIRENNNQRNLYRSRVNHSAGNTDINTAPLLEGVENMQILYGEDINGDGSSIRYVDANTIAADMSKVISVRIHLLLATAEDNLASSKQQYWYLNCDAGAPNTVALCNANDRRLYRSFTTTVQLRNQGIGI
ncbi:MAG TPA: hypothetical protein ENJ65_03720 [Candidatus Tenderia electrophaga]|uniref:Pilus assembly protein PilW n=1 Tax=Candidatus Tenderia electrophaga TaxID=1748243 RepID=A0A832N575_9GAMM|nr:hypothetical protein [Candidatus Tenderia electrophaga]